MRISFNCLADLESANDNEPEFRKYTYIIKINGFNYSKELKARNFEEAEKRLPQGASYLGEIIWEIKL